MHGFLESVSLRHPEEQKVPPLQFVVSKLCHKSSSHAMLWPTSSQTCSNQEHRLEQARASRVSLMLPLLPGDRMHTRVAGA